MRSKHLHEINQRFNHETHIFQPHWKMQAVPCEEDDDGIIIKHAATIETTSVRTVLSEQMDPPHWDAIRNVECIHDTVSRLSGRLFRIIMLGDSGVGKTTMVSSLVGLSAGDLKATVAVDLKVVWHAGHQFHIWDTAGQERFQSVVASYYRHLNCALVTFDLTNRKSFEHIPTWLSQLERYADHDIKNIHLMLLGNKMDLESGREVSHTEAVAFAKKHSMQYIEMSALSTSFVQPNSDPKLKNEHVENLFTSVFEWLIKHHCNARSVEKFPKTRIGVTIQPEPIVTNSACC